MQQVDVETAFYRIDGPEVLSEYFRLPPVDLDALREVRPDLQLDHLPGRRATPRLAVLAMGWSWSLFFCQRLVEQRVLDAGYPESALVRDRHHVGDMSDGTVCAVYVDGAAVVGSSRARVSHGILAVDTSLNSAGLKPKASLTTRTSRCSLASPSSASQARSL